ncbi:MAG: hypothetical protein ACOX5F_05315 [Anaerovoracaceae bacterium]
MKERQRSTKNDAMIALADIHQKYPNIKTTDIEKFAPVYYPIAIIEMDLEEKTFEDFESVQYSILNLVSLGITDYNVIAETLGLSPNYVFKIIRLLNGYGHMDGDGITEMGRESVREGKKIVKSQVWQKFQVDALNGTLLKVEQVVVENMLNEKNKTRMTIGHLNYLDGMSVEDISSQLEKNDYNSYIRQKSSILNTNVIKINNIRCLEVRYAKSYMIKVRDCDEPIVFAKRYDSKQREVKERFYWEPFSVESKAIQSRLGFGSDIPVSSNIARNYISQLYSMMIDRADRADLMEEIIWTMKWIYPFHEEGIKIVQSEDSRAIPVVNIYEKAFQKYRSWIINFLIGIQEDGEYLITHERLYGNIVSLRTDSPLLLDVAKLLVEKIEKYGKLDLIKRFRDKFNDYEGEDNIITLMGKELKTM